MIKKICFFCIVLFASYLPAQDIVIMQPNNKDLAMDSSSIRKLVINNLHKLDATDVRLKVFKTKTKNQFIIFKLSLSYYHGESALVHIDKDSLQVVKMPYLSTPEDLELYTGDTPLPKAMVNEYDFMFDTPNSEISAAISAINTCSNYAANQNYRVLTYLGSSATVQNFKDAITNNNLIAVGITLVSISVQILISLSKVLLLFVVVKIMKE